MYCGESIIATVRLVEALKPPKKDKLRMNPPEVRVFPAAGLPVEKLNFEFCMLNVRANVEFTQCKCSIIQRTSWKEDVPMDTGKSPVPVIALTMPQQKLLNVAVEKKLDFILYTLVSLWLCHKIISNNSWLLATIADQETIEFHVSTTE